MRKPVIAMPASTMIVEDHVFTGMYRPFVNQDYIDCIEAAGGIPVIVPVMNEEDSYELIKFADGVLLPGGHDIAPNLYGEDPIPEQGLSYESVDRLYIHMVRQAHESKKPVLGICKGLILHLAVHCIRIFRPKTKGYINIGRRHREIILPM